MCLAVPGKIVDVRNDAEPRMGTVDFGGVRKDVCLELLPEARIGDYVVVHVGFALSILDEEEAMETLRLFAAMENGPSGSAGPQKEVQ